MKPKNINDDLPNNFEKETFEDIIRTANTRIERIVSKGHRSPEVGWYDQDEAEWVLVISGSATLEFENGSVCRLSAGDYLNIPAHCKHKVTWTDPAVVTLWLAVFYK